MTRRIRVALINPNASEFMTQQMLDTLQRSFGDRAEITGTTNTGGPASIQGPEDVAACLGGVRSAYGRAVAQGAEVAIIGCFDDTGVAELRARGPIPVVGLGEAACTAASRAAHSFVVVTTLAVSIPEITRNIGSAGLSAHCAAVIASGVPVLELGSSVARIDAAIAQALKDHPSAAVVLGCSGMTAIVSQLAPTDGSPVIDPVQAAGEMAVAAVRVG